MHRMILCVRQNCIFLLLIIIYFYLYDEAHSRCSNKLVVDRGTVQQSFSKEDHCTINKFLLLQQKSTKEMQESLVASLGEFCPPYETVRRRCRAFEAGRVEAEDAPKSGRTHFGTHCATIFR